MPLAPEFSPAARALDLEAFFIHCNRLAMAAVELAAPEDPQPVARPEPPTAERLAQAS
jgi:hypothetical protein